jgi:hypothetical protein
MRIDVYGLILETDEVTIHLWSPWRASALEHKLFDAVRNLAGSKFEIHPDEWRIRLKKQEQFEEVFQTFERILKGWQEEASDVGSDRRVWRWILEADIDAHGYDQTGEKASAWLFLRVALERGTMGEEERPEEIDLNGLGMEIHPMAH